MTLDELRAVRDKHLVEADELYDALSGAIGQIEQASSIIGEMKNYSDPEGITIKLLKKIEDALLKESE